MVKEIMLDRTFDTGDTYKTTDRDYFVFRKIGYNEATTQTLTVDGSECLEVHQELCPLAYNPDTNIFGMVDLRDLFTVIPPETKFELSGTGQLLRCKGVHGILEPHEDMPGRYMSRFKNQDEHYWTVEQLKTTQNIGTSGEYVVDSLTPTHRGEYTFNHRAVKIDVGGQVTSWDQAWIRFYISNNPTVAYLPENDQWGWDILSFPQHDDTGLNGKAMFMEDREQELEESVEWELRIYSDGDITGGANDIGLMFFNEYKSPTL